MKCLSCLSMLSLVIGGVLLCPFPQHPARADDPLVTTPTVRVVFVSSTHDEMTTSTPEAAADGPTYLRFDIEGAGWSGLALPRAVSSPEALMGYTYRADKSNCTGWPCGGGSIKCGNDGWCPAALCIKGICAALKTTQVTSSQTSESDPTLTGSFALLHDRLWVFDGRNAIHVATDSGTFAAALVGGEPVTDTEHFQYLGSAFLTLSGCDGPLMGGTFGLDDVIFVLADGTQVEPSVEPAEVAVTCVSPPGRPVLFQVFNPCASGVLTALAFSLIGLVQLRWLRWSQARRIPR